MFMSRVTSKIMYPMMNGKLQTRRGNEKRKGPPQP
jgi:hypothetical protein